MSLCLIGIAAFSATAIQAALAAWFIVKWQETGDATYLACGVFSGVFAAGCFAVNLNTAFRR